MIEKPQNFDSVFRYIVVVSQRAEQLVNGAKHRSESRHLKPTLIAKDDVDQELVGWRVLTQEELDAQRQAIVDQFRAEVGGDATAPEAPKPIPDVLPTAIPFTGLDDEEADEEDRDDELDRLQRLLGLAGRARTEDDEGSEEDSEEDSDEDSEDDEDSGEDADELGGDLDEDALDLDDEAEAEDLDDDDEDE